MSWIEDPGLATYGGFNISELDIDEAWVNVSTTIADTALWLYEVSTNCHRVSASSMTRKWVIIFELSESKLKIHNGTLLFLVSISTKRRNQDWST